MTVGVVFFAYALPLAVLCFGALLIREYGYPCILRIIAYWLLREAERSERAQLKHHDELRRRLEDVA